MKLILTQDVEHVGIPGDVVEVKDGYGRNYLLPQGFAIKWTKGAEKQIEGIKRAKDARVIRSETHAQEIREQLEALKVSVPARTSGDSGRLFGAVTASEIALAVKKAGGPAVDKRAVEIAKPIKTVGSHTVGIKLTLGITAHITVAVVAAK
ncbi:MAG: 50S ribosomal protein L9 [Propionibacteriaceae bacterium]|jgi:large subunit ribosomal protein L9|nr:50S ribosomal protein L9 [Propionibacteriaceae bacterium]